MIVDTLENAGMYVSLGEKLARGLEVLSDPDLSEKEDGKYVVDDDVFYIVQQYVTKDFESSRLEAHRRYIDIQYCTSGEEMCGWSPVEDLQIQAEYDQKKDLAFFDTPDQMGAVLLKPGTFAIFFPDDAHMPGLSIDEPQNIRKVVVKIPV